MNSWLNGLVVLIDINYEFYSRFEVVDISKNESGYTLTARAWGEKIDFSKHVTKTEVKAMTYADMHIDVSKAQTLLRFTLYL